MGQFYFSTFKKNQQIIGNLLNLLNQIHRRLISFLYRHLLGEEIDKDVKEYFLKGSVASFSISIGSSFLALLIGFALAKLLGAEDFGTYTYIFSWIMLLSVLASFGIDDLSVREVSKYQSNNNNNELRGFLRWSFLTVLGLSLLVSLLLYFVFQIFTLPGIEGHQSLFSIALIAVPVIALIHLSQGQLRGLAQVIPGKLPENIIRPIFLIVFIIIILVNGNSLTVNDAVIGNTIAFVIALLVSLTFLVKHSAGLFAGGNIESAIDQRSMWVKSAPFFFFLSAIEIINSRADILMLGILSDSMSVGIYGIAARLVDFIPFVLMVINPVLAPVISKLYYSNSTRKLEVLYRKSARITFFMALPVFVLLAVFGKEILSLFGSDFLPGYYVLIILGTSQLFNAFTGSVGNMLLMTGFEKETLISYGASVVLNILLNLWLIPIYGIYGAALATAFSLFLSNLLMCIYVFRKIGVSPLGWTKKPE